MYDKRLPSKLYEKLWNLYKKTNNSLQNGQMFKHFIKEDRQQIKAGKDAQYN